MRMRLVSLALLVVLGGCDRVDAGAGEAGGRPVVAVSVYPVASIVRFVGGEAVTVRTLLPGGASPDSYEATPRVAEAVADAALVVRVGGAVDDWLGGSGGTRELVLTDGMRLKAAAESGHEGTGNPHVWLDPVLVRDTLLPRLVEALARVAADSAPAVRARGAAYADSLTALDAEIRYRLRNVPHRRFVAAHPAWVYFADRYGLVEMGSLHPSPGTEPGSRDLARLVDEARAAGVGAVIAEPQLGRAGIASLADELDARVGVADPLGAPGVEGRGDYLSLMRYNAAEFARALGGGS